MSELHLTERALGDLLEIERFSLENRGPRVADRYMADPGEAPGRLMQDLSLFRPRHDYAGRLRFYRVREHVLVGDVVGGVGYILTVWHGSMDFIERLPELEPQLRQEAEFMARGIEEEQG